VDGREGVSYLWSRKEIESILGNTEAAAFFQVYSLTPRRTPASGATTLARTRVLRVRMPVADTLKRVGATDMASALALLPLIGSPSGRAGPSDPTGADEKIVVAWNGLAIAALVRSAEVLRQPAYLDLATRDRGTTLEGCVQSAYGGTNARNLPPPRAGSWLSRRLRPAWNRLPEPADATRETVWHDRALD